MTAQFRLTDLQCEIRAAGPVGMRPSPSGGRMFTGVIPYNRLSGPIPAGQAGTFVEVIDPHAFDHTLAAGTDVVALQDHDGAKILGRLSAGTLRLSTDANALRFSIDAEPPTTYAADLAILLERGDVCGSSFAFRVSSENGDAWSYTESGQPLRRLLNVHLIDVSVVGSPAYPASTAAVHQAMPMAPAMAMAGRSDGLARASAERGDRIRSDYRAVLGADQRSARRRQLLRARLH